jgi:hypothetical protein
MLRLQLGKCLSGLFGRECEGAVPLRNYSSRVYDDQQRTESRQPSLAASKKSLVVRNIQYLTDIEHKSDQVDRAIRTGKLNALLRLHTRPINVVVFHGS